MKNGRLSPSTHITTIRLWITLLRKLSPMIFLGPVLFINVSITMICLKRISVGECLIESIHCIRVMIIIPVSMTKRSACNLYKSSTVVTRRYIQCTMLCQQTYCCIWMATSRKPLTVASLKIINYLYQAYSIPWSLLSPKVFRMKLQSSCEVILQVKYWYCNLSISTALADTKTSPF